MHSYARESSGNKRRITNRNGTLDNKLIIHNNNNHTISLPAMQTVSSSSLCQEHPCWNQFGSSFAVHRTTKADVRFYTRRIPNNNKPYYGLSIVIRRNLRPMVPNPISQLKSPAATTLRTVCGATTTTMRQTAAARKTTVSQSRRKRRPNNHGRPNGDDDGYIGVPLFFLLLVPIPT